MKIIMPNLVISRINRNGMARDSIIMIAASLATGLFTYLFQFSMGILLSPDNYAVLLSLTSLLIVLTTFTQTIGFTAAKITSRLISEDRPAAVNYFWRSLVRRTIFIGVLTFSIVLAISPFVAKFLRIHDPSLFFVSFGTLIFAFALSANWGVLQGLQKFSSLGLSQILFGCLRFALGIVLVYLGFGLTGGLAAIPLSYIIVFAISFLPLRKLSKAGYEKTPATKINSFVWLTLLAVTAITTLINIDVILAKHYLSSEIAGSYSIIAILGRVAFYAPAGIGTALFPKAVASNQSGGNHRKLFFIAVSMTLGIICVICLGYGLLSADVIRFQFPDKYLVAIPYLFKYGLGMSFISLSSIVMTYLLSLGKTSAAYPMSTVAIFQVILIWFFHTNIGQFVNIMLLCGILSLLLVIPFLFTTQRKKKL